MKVGSGEGDGEPTQPASKDPAPEWVRMLMEQINDGLQDDLWQLSNQLEKRCDQMERMDRKIDIVQRSRESAPPNLSCHGAVAGPSQWDSTKHIILRCSPSLCSRTTSLTSMPTAQYLARKYYWDSGEKVDRLHKCLRGSAIHFVCSLPEYIREDNDSLVAHLQTRFGQREPPTTTRRKLGELKQGMETSAEFTKEEQFESKFDSVLEEVKQMRVELKALHNLLHPTRAKEHVQQGSPATCPPSLTTPKNSGAVRA
ncbi:hypothetical protein J4Q44_G00035120 [Coregonus suidteri]|uniref:Uncharacterized protein n=1 Tax=Coregonus suidteri TaxID=861788 RepID=A0AAN8MIU3_9TELE